MNQTGPASWQHLVTALHEWFDELYAGGVFMTDTELRVRAWNRWLEIHTGRPTREVLGLPLLDAFPEIAERGLAQYYHDALSGEARVVAFEFHRYLLAIPARSPAAMKPAAGIMPQSARIAPLRSGGEIVGTITVIDNVTERVVSERELRNQIAALERARATAEAAVRAKDEFLATLSHELRTPLNAVLGWMRLLLSGALPPDKIRHAMDVVERNATVQAQLIDDMLDVARIMQGKLRLEIRPMDMVRVIQAALDIISPAADAKGLIVITHLDADAAAVSGDPDRLQQVVWNLLSNAVKFTDAGGRIDLSLERHGNVSELSVRDSGRGIAPEFLPCVFDRFRQEDSTTTRRYGGLGLGLSLVRQLVELHGGSVQAASAGEDQGATFTVRLPLRHSAPGLPARGFDESTEQDGVLLAERRILVIDDDPDAREMLSAVLVRYGAKVVGVGSAAEGYEVLTRRRGGEAPQILLADIGMPGEDGYTLMRRIRNLAADVVGGIPAIAVTGYAAPEDRRRALEAGFDRHFAKPVDPAALARAVMELLPGTKAAPVPGAGD
jgi:signal transduction histidine kinase/ActR/RegA family two-component response regulator